MLKAITHIFFAIMISFTIIFSNIAYGSDVMKSGAILQEDSIVFSVDEADDLRKRIEELELKEERLVAVQDLIVVQEKQINTLDELLEVKNAQITEWKSLGELHQNRIKDLERQENLNILRNIGYLALGMVVAGGAIYIGDKVGDTVETN